MYLRGGLEGFLAVLLAYTCTEYGVYTDKASGDAYLDVGGDIMVGLIDWRSDVALECAPRT